MGGEYFFAEIFNLEFRAESLTFIRHLRAWSYENRVHFVLGGGVHTLAQLFYDSYSVKIAVGILKYFQIMQNKLLRMGFLFWGCLQKYSYLEKYVYTLMHVITRQGVLRFFKSV